MNFRAAGAKISLISIDKGSLEVTAQYNPKELQVDQNVPWKKPDAATQAGQQAAGGGKSKGPDENYMALEFTGAEGRTMTVELLFDSYQAGGASRPAVSVQGEVAKLEEMARVMEPESQDEKKRRPHHLTVRWGGTMWEGGRLDCVIESLSTKYSMFSTDGEPLRATCTVKLKEAKRVDKKKQ
ncbi:MAG TPA: hypothetical protein VIU61_01720 [Kofleriaceae bacterium]